MRRLSNDRLAPSAPVVREMAGRTVWTATFRFITPVFGGGVQVDGHKKPFDPVTPVRVPSIRGQLRLWWRAVNPRGCEDSEQLAKAEAVVFGEAAKPGGVQSKGLSIRVLKQPENPAEMQAFFSEPNRAQKGWVVKSMQPGVGYGAFPLRDDRKEIRFPTSHEHGTLWNYGDQEWRIELSFDTSDRMLDDVAAALWAWSHFGGLGGRTRRGFGAIDCKECSQPISSIEDGWDRWKLSEAHEVSWGHLRGRHQEQCAQGRTSYPSGLDALERLLARFQQFRQGVGNGRNSGDKGRPGRSRWPEPDEIRRLTNCKADNHAPVHPVSKFPRAVFGTPIIFHFKDHDKRRPDAEDADPADSTLNPLSTGRFASPLILRPTLENGRYVARAVRLHGTMPSTFALTMGKTTYNGLSARLTTQEANLVTPLGGEADPIARYFKLLRNG